MPARLTHGPVPGRRNSGTDSPDPQYRQALSATKTIPEYGSDATNTDTVVLVPVTGSKIAIFVPAQSTCIVCPGTWAIRIVSSLTSTYAPMIWQNR